MIRDRQYHEVYNNMLNESIGDKNLKKLGFKLRDEIQKMIGNKFSSLIDSVEPDDDRVGAGIKSQLFEGFNNVIEQVLKDYDN